MPKITDDIPDKKPITRRRYEMTPARKAALERMQEARKRQIEKFRGKVIQEDENTDSDMNEPDEDVNTVVQNNKEVIDLTNSTDEEDDVAEDINNDVPAEEVKKQRKPYKNYSRELKEYLETTHLVDHIKSLEDELQQHKDIINKHKDMMSVMNDELIKKNKKIKRLKNKQYGPDDIND